MFHEVNYLAVIVSAIIYWLLGGLWYAAIFREPWYAALNLSEEQHTACEKRFPMALFAYFFSGLIVSFVLEGLLHVVGAETIHAGMFWGFHIWLGFAFTLSLNSLYFEMRGLKVFLINNGNYLLSFVLLGGILAVW